MVHGQLTVPKSGGGYQTVDVQDGTVTAVSTGSVTVKSADGFTATYTVTSKTVVDAEAAGIGSVKKGDTIFVTATVSGSTATAANILDLTAVKAGRASFGFPVPQALADDACSAAPRLSRRAVQVLERPPAVDELAEQLGQRPGPLDRRRTGHAERHRLCYRAGQEPPRFVRWA